MDLITNILKKIINKLVTLLQGIRPQASGTASLEARFQRGKILRSAARGSRQLYRTETQGWGSPERELQRALIPRLFAPRVPTFREFDVQFISHSPRNGQGERALTQYPHSWLPKEKTEVGRDKVICFRSLSELGTELGSAPNSPRLAGQCSF